MGRPGHISPCFGSQCPICHGETIRWGDLADASIAIQRAMHKTKDREQAVKLWRAKILVDEVAAQAQADGEFDLWLEDMKALKQKRAEGNKKGRT